MKNNAIELINTFSSPKSSSHSSSSASSTSSFSTAEQQTFDQAADVLKTLAHPLRIRIVLALARNRSMNVSALQRLLKVDQAILSYQLTKMRDKGLLTSARQGKEVHYSLTSLVLSEIMSLLLAGKLV